MRVLTLLSWSLYLCKGSQLPGQSRQRGPCGQTEVNGDPHFFTKKQGAHLPELQFSHVPNWNKSANWNKRAKLRIGCRSELSPGLGTYKELVRSNYPVLIADLTASPHPTHLQRHTHLYPAVI